MDKSFKCQDCSQYFKDEDYNAALNIANPDFKAEVEQAGSAASK
jgi:transposase